MAAPQMAPARHRYYIVGMFLQSAMTASDPRMRAIAYSRASQRRTFTAMNSRDDGLFSEFSGRCEEARATLRGHMRERGLREQDGWTIHEFTRQVDGHTEIVMRPMHRHLDPPPGLECKCEIDEPGSHISAGCHTSRYLRRLDWRMLGLSRSMSACTCSRLRS
jgi:hypothetical protein